MELAPLQLVMFKEFFQGSDRGYGQHVYDGVQEGLKKVGKSWSVDEIVTDKLYRDHLEGRQGLGIVPINNENRCKFTVIDVDVYGKSLQLFVNAIDRNAFPMVPFRSKSGGLHIYVFFNEFVDVEEALEHTKKLALVLGVDKFVKDASETRAHSLEIFPKQVRKQKVGSWINLPYYNAVNGSTQVALTGTSELGFDDAMQLIKERSITMTGLRSFIDNLPFQDAPPCLQTIYLLDAVGKNEGRNNYLFSWGAYFKKKDEMSFDAELYKINDALSEPISDNELDQTVINSLRKKDYNYTCKQPPCANFCNRTECRNREFGVGKVDGYFSGLEFGQLTQFKQDKPYYEWEIKQQGDDGEYKLLRFKDETEIIRQDSFLQLCFRELHILPVKLKMPAWFKIVNQSLESIMIVDVDAQYDTSPIILLKRYIYEFLEERARARIKHDILSKRVYYDERTQEYLFRTADLLEFLLINKNFRSVDPNTINAVLRDIGCEKRQIKTEKRMSLRVTALPVEKFKNNLTVVLMAVEDQEEEEETNDEEAKITDLEGLDEHAQAAATLFEAPQNVDEATPRKIVELDDADEVPDEYEEDFSLNLDLLNEDLY